MPTASTGDLKKLYDEFRGRLQDIYSKLKQQASKPGSPPGLDDFLNSCYGNARDGLEGAIKFIESSNKFLAVRRPAPAEAQGIKAAKAGPPADYLKYIADYFVRNPDKDKLYLSQILRDTGANRSTVRDYLENLPLPLGKDEHGVYLGNETILLENTAVPKSLLAIWKNLGVLEEQELYLYAKQRDVEGLADAIRKYRGSLKLELPEINLASAQKYPLYRQLSKIERLMELLGDEAETKSLLRGPVLLFKWEKEAQDKAVPVIYFLAKDYRIPGNEEHLISPVIALLKKQGMFLAELVQALDKPASRITHALDILTGAGRTGCPYSSILPEKISCPKLPGVASKYSLPESFGFMSNNMRAAYIACLRFGVLPEVEMSKGHPKQCRASIAGQDFTMRSEGIYNGSNKIGLPAFRNILSEHYRKNLNFGV